MHREYVESGSPYEDRYGFARAVRIGDRIIVSGTAPIPPPGEPVVETAYEQMRRCGDIAFAALARLGATPADVIRTRMYITDPTDAEEVGRAHGGLFASARPAATMVVVASLVEPEWKVELEVEAVVGGSAGG